MVYSLLVAACCNVTSANWSPFEIVSNRLNQFSIAANFFGSFVSLA